MTRLFFPICFFALTLGLLTPYRADAKIYECVKNHQIIYTNKPGKNCKSASLNDLGLYSSDHQAYQRQEASVMRHAQPQNPPTTTTPTTNTHISAATQQQRDNNRLLILQRELSNEEQALQQAKNRLQQNSRVIQGETAEDYRSRIEKLQGAVFEHQSNIDAIKKEISRL